MESLVSRRAIITAGIGVPLVALGLSGCAAAAAVVFDPAVDGWLATLVAGIGANVISDSIDKGIDAAWKNWRKPVEKSIDKVGPSHYIGTLYGHQVPPVALMQFCNGKEADPHTDTLVAYVDGGEKYIVFEPWAWQGLSMFVHDLTTRKKGNELAAYKALCAITLAPSGTTPVSGASPAGAVAYMNYQARSGIVEIARFDSTVQVSVSGIPTSKGLPTVRQFTLPHA